MIIYIICIYNLVLGVQNEPQTEILLAKTSELQDRLQSLLRSLPVRESVTPPGWEVLHPSPFHPNFSPSPSRPL